MARNGYTGISIPEPLTRQIEDFISTNKHGYKSKGEFVKDAIRQLLEKFNGNGGNGAFSTTTTTTTSDPISPTKTKTEKKDQT